METTTAKTSAASAALLQDILDLIVPATLRISPDGKHVVYSTKLKLNHKKSASATAVAAIWIAETAVPKSARPFTTGGGQCFDWMPEWSPDGNSVAFLSNRGSVDGDGDGDGRGGSQQRKKTIAIYLQSRHNNTPPRAVTPVLDGFASISKIAFSPDGKHIAFTAPSWTKNDKDKNKIEGADAVVWGKDADFQHLWLVDVESGALRVLFDGDAQVDDFVWCDGGDGGSSGDLAVMTHRSPHADSKYQHGTTVAVLHVEDRQLRQLCHVPRVVWSPVWFRSALYFLANNVPDQDTSGMAVYRVHDRGHAQEQQAMEKVAHGEVDCAAGLVRADDEIVVYVEHGVEDQLRLLGGKTLVSQNKRIVDYAVSGAAHDLHIVLSWGDINTPTELFSFNIHTGESLQLSDHGRAFSRTAPFGHCHFLSHPTLDGKEMLDSLYLVPAQCGNQTDTKDATPPTTRLPTLVLLHGGPYGRRTDAFDAYDPFSLLLQPLLAERCGVLVVNYRGGSGRGERFASYARGGMGAFDEPDVAAAVQHAVVRGYADPARLVVAGWSQGGYLAYLSAVRNGAHGLGWRFAGAIAGAGVTDWDSMALASDVGAGYESQFAGGAPWAADKDDVRARSGSALWEFKEAARHGRIPPMLMLHGEKDARVPISQAWGFQRALDAAGLPFEFVTYPREGHVPRERRHIEDMAERILRFVRTHLA